MVHRVLAASHRRVGRCHAGDNGVTTLSKLKTVELKLPATTEDLRKLEIGTANFHCSPAARIEPDGTFNVGAVTATASFRFAKWLDEWLKLSGCNIIIGKGGMTSEVYRD